MATTEVEFRCFVGGLAWATDSHTLEEAFRPFGEILESKVRSLIPNPFSLFRFDFGVDLRSRSRGSEI